MADKRFIYMGSKFRDITINPICYNPGLFQKELDMESEVFFDLRKKNGIFPVRINESPQKDLDQIRDYFYSHKKNFFFLLKDDSEIIGSVLFVKNYIQSLSIAKKYQRQGYGEILSKYCINRILDKSYTCVELNVLNGNSKAEALYKKLGFKEL